MSIHSSTGEILKNSVVELKSGGWTQAEWAKGSGYIIEAHVLNKRRVTVKAKTADLPTKFVL